MWYLSKELFYYIVNLKEKFVVNDTAVNWFISYLQLTLGTSILIGQVWQMRYLSKELFYYIVNLKEKFVVNDTAVNWLIS